MGKLTFDISMSLDGFVAGPNVRPEAGLGEGGERLHEWAYDLKAFREPHGESGGEVNPDSEVLEETMQAPGAMLVGRGMFGGGTGPWGEDRAWGDKPWDGWWGDEPPFFRPVFVITHHGREPLVKGETTFTFVTDGIESALEQARAAAGDRDVAIGGGANVIQQYLKAGLVDEFQIHIAPIFLGQGVRLFDDCGDLDSDLEIARVVESPAVTHVRYRVVR
jgi:dihydrofolate reductase